MLNHITIMGRFTKDPELRRTDSGTAVASFSIANDSDFKDKNGNRKTIFVNCVAWRSTAEYVSKYFSKGRMAVVHGALDIRDWTDKEGNKRQSAEITVENVYFADSKKDDNSYGGNSYAGNGGTMGSYAAPAYPQPVSYGGDFERIDEDDAQLPF